MSKYVRDSQIASMSYNELVKALTSGAVTVERLKSYYVDARRKAMSRDRSRQKVGDQFGGLDKQYFTKVKNLTSTSSLLHEISDVNRFLGSKKSTITGLKQIRENTINRAESLGFDLNYDNYSDWVRFMNWFKSSEFAKAFDSSSEELAEAFNNADSATPKDWSKALEEFTRRENDKRKQY